MFSVIIPLYNKELSVKSTIESVLNQTFMDFEILVVNDGSTDNSVKIVESFSDPRIRLIHQENQGVSAARNLGIRKAKYEWNAFLDADDFWESNHLEVILGMIHQFPNKKVFVTSHKFSPDRKIFRHPRKTKIFQLNNYFEESLKENLIWTGETVVHKSCFDAIGYFNPILSHGEDMEMWTRLVRQFPVIKTTEITAQWNLEAENRSHKTMNIQKTRLYLYDFKNASSREEIIYYKKIISQTLFKLLYQRNFRDFYLLWGKHKTKISVLYLLKYNYSSVFLKRN